MGTFDSLPISILSKSLDGLWKRQQVTMENIANYSTPGYKSKTVNFEQELQDRLQVFDNKIKLKESVLESRITIKENNSLSQRLDGNNVDYEQENIELAKTQLNYMYSVSEMNSYFGKLRMAISEGKK